jgi:hypothetical protein
MGTSGSFYRCAYRNDGAFAFVRFVRELYVNRSKAFASKFFILMDKMITIVLFLVGIIFIHSGIYQLFGGMDWYKRFSNMRVGQLERPPAPLETSSTSIKGFQSANAYSGISRFLFGVVLMIAGAWFSR